MTPSCPNEIPEDTSRKIGLTDNGPTEAQSLVDAGGDTEGKSTETCMLSLNCVFRHTV